MPIKRLFDAVERGGDIGRRVAALVLPISNRPRVTSSCAGKMACVSPASIRAARIWRPETMLLISRIYIRFWKRRYRSSRVVESRPGHTPIRWSHVGLPPRMLAQIAMRRTDITEYLAADSAAMGSKADTAASPSHVRFTPKADK